MHRLIPYLLKTILFFVLVWMGGLGLFFASIPTQVKDEQTSTQAVIVLTGGRERLKTGFQLLCAQRAPLIFISGVHPGETLKSLLKSLEASSIVCHQDQGQFASRTYLGYTAKNTQENAKETAAWVKQMTISSLRLVTAAYHMPRSLLELKHLLPHTVIIPHPVFPSAFKQSHWWWKPNIFYLIFSEYNKFLWAFVRIHLTR